MDHSLILTMLMQREYVSGEWISGQLGVTRAAVWKAVEALRAAGHDIQSVKKRGYHLAPPEDAVWPMCIRKHLKTEWAGGEIEYHAVIDSTNLRAKELARSDAPHGTLVVADRQTQGRGRLSRGWEASAGEAILMSLIVRPEWLHPSKAPALVIVAALAVADVCADTGIPVQIKWPNDLIFDARKLCGMLLEMGADMDHVQYAVIGAGLNVGGYPGLESCHATSLAEALGRPIDRARLIAGFLEHFERHFARWQVGGMGAILPDYRAKSITLGRQIRVISGQEQYRGVALDVQDDGSLVIAKDDGESVVVCAGDVSVRGVMGYV